MRIWVQVIYQERFPGKTGKGVEKQDRQWGNFKQIPRKGGSLNLCESGMCRIYRGVQLAVIFLHLPIKVKGCHWGEDCGTYTSSGLCVPIDKVTPVAWESPQEEESWVHNFKDKGFWSRWRSAWKTNKRNLGRAKGGFMPRVHERLIENEWSSNQLNLIDLTG